METGSTEAGFLAFGFLVGWLLAYTLRRNKINWKQFYAVVTFLGGGAVGSYSLDTVFKMSSFGYFWIGLVVGFFANIVVREVSYRKGWKTIEDLSVFRLPSLPVSPSPPERVPEAAGISSPPGPILPTTVRSRARRRDPHV